MFLKEEGQDLLRSCMRGVYHRKAALIQACVRAMQGSMKLKEKKAAALVIHSTARMFLLRTRYRGLVAKVGIVWVDGGGACCVGSVRGFALFCAGASCGTVHC